MIGRLSWAGLLGAAVFWVGPCPVWGQLSGEAAVGEPFGVAQVSVPFSPDDDAVAIEAGAFTVEDPQGRVLYPVFVVSHNLALLRELLGQSQPGPPDRLLVHFLFTGREPLDVTVRTPSVHRLHVVPQDHEIVHRRLSRAWWLRYRAGVRRQMATGDYPPAIETYLMTMLGQRLGQAIPLPGSSWSGIEYETIQLLLPMERLRTRTMQETMSQVVPRDVPATEPVPAPIPWRAVAVEESSATVVEPLALQVPENCFYLRFGRFNNYLWLRHLLEEYGGDMSRMVTLRGNDARLNERVESQLGLRESAMARALGAQVISDVAVIGRDTFLSEGAALGILFEAKNDEVLAADLQKQRDEAVRTWQDRGATQSIVRIADHDVSFASTPDNRLRSYYVRKQQYHLVTNCRAIAEHFLAIQDGRGSLGQTNEFRFARRSMPLADPNEITIYLSRGFFQSLLSPQYQVELRRRLQSLTDAQLWQMARLAARAEQQPDTEMATLVRAGYLPADVSRQVAGNGLELRDGVPYDRLRGAIGTYLPVPDVPLEGVTTFEASKFAELARFHTRDWRELDPVLIGVQRYALADREDAERVVIDGQMLPFDRDKYGTAAGIFGPATGQRIQPLDGDIVSVQAVLRMSAANADRQPYHLYFALRDEASPQPSSERRLLRSLQIARSAPAYLAAWPRPGILDLIGPEAVDNKLARFPFGLWRLTTEQGFSVLSFDPRIVRDVAPQLLPVNDADPAQIQIHVGDISQSKFGRWANELDYLRGFETSLGNVRLMHMLAQQFRLPVQDAKTVAERLLDVNLVCALGGRYELVARDDGTSYWVSDQWKQSRDAGLATYRSPLMTWLRGLDASIQLHEDRLLFSGQMDVERAPEDSKLKLPTFQFFGGKEKASGNETER